MLIGRLVLADGTAVLTHVHAGRLKPAAAVGPQRPGEGAMRTVVLERPTVADQPQFDVWATPGASRRDVDCLDDSN